MSDTKSGIKSYGNAVVNDLQKAINHLTNAKDELSRLKTSVETKWLGASGTAMAQAIDAVIKKIDQDSAKISAVKKAAESDYQHVLNNWPAEKKD